MILLTLYLLFSSFSNFSIVNSTLLPRMTFTDKESPMMQLQFPPLKTVLEAEADVVTAVGRQHIHTLHFDTQQTVESKVEWEECMSSGVEQRDCSYTITVAHKRKGNEMFVCGSNGRETVCCNMNSTTEASVQCVPSDNIQWIQESIRDFNTMEHEPSAVVESTEGDEFYVTLSGSGDYVGINKFGKHRVGPVYHDKEQNYVGLWVSRVANNPKQDKVYSFYKEKNKNPELDSEMWVPFVTQVCMSDTGGPKNNMQFRWTSQMNAKLFCGDLKNKKHFSELVDVATVPASNWMDTRVYALFRNEWGMSAVCVYTIKEIDQTFKTSPFKDSDMQTERPRTCVPDSTKIPFDTLRKIKETSDMEAWVHPVDGSGPLHISHHNYTHMSVEDVEDKLKERHTLLFLSLHNGGVQKVMQSNNQTFIIAEYQPFSQRTHPHSITFDRSARKLYVSSRGQLVQLDVANCAQYGHTCEDCVLSRDPYCSWSNKRCTAHAQEGRQDVEHGDTGICTTVVQTSKSVASAPHFQSHDTVTLPLQARYFLRCPVTSHHAQYTWHHANGTTPCSSKEQQCLLLIDHMSPEHVGTYSCVSEERGYSKVLTQQRLLLDNRAPSCSPERLIWVTLVTALLVLT